MTKLRDAALFLEPVFGSRHLADCTDRRPGSCAYGNHREIPKVQRIVISVIKNLVDDRLWGGSNVALSNTQSERAHNWRLPHT